MSRGRVWVEKQNGIPVRIFRSMSAAFHDVDKDIVEMPKKDAVGIIRAYIFKISGGKCRNCGKIVVGSGHMHELVNRSQGGEISIWNSVILCAKCHLQKEHGWRNPRFGEKNAT